MRTYHWTQPTEPRAVWGTLAHAGPFSILSSLALVSECSTPHIAVHHHAPEAWNVLTCAATPPSPINDHAPPFWRGGSCARRACVLASLLRVRCRMQDATKMASCSKQKPFNVEWGGAAVDELRPIARLVNFCPSRCCRQKRRRKTPPQIDNGEAAPVRVGRSNR